MPLRYLFVDMNSFFASVEQQLDPALRGKPVAVIPTQADTTFCIAASYEAKAFGVKTGTPVWEAKQLCPRIILREARHREYVTFHNRVVDAIGSVIPVKSIASIDEMSCRLVESERKRDRVVEIGRAIKDAIYRRAGDQMRCSIGAGPNEILAKMGSDFKKPDGLTVFADDDLPHRLHVLPIEAFPGVGPRMKRRLNLHGVFTTEQFCAAPVSVLAAVWGSKLLGEKWYRTVRGEDVPERPTRRQTVGHSHVLPPGLRTDEGAYGVMVRLTHKAVARLRKVGYWTGGVSVGVSYLGEPGTVAAPSGWGKAGWGARCRFPHREDTPGVLRAVSDMWATRPPGGVPFKVGMVLTDLRPAANATPSLFEIDRKEAELSHAMDDVNAEFGGSVVHFGGMWGLKDAAPTRVAFTQIPDFDRRVV
ncbi:DNA polymerase Y family protein [Urbifossiella limnaea]|uniref:DNA polymerase IV n=1 Tax=Urbifossiella limnaea TaxID=2528023 RepID=A0A517XR92_9BACT|nr:DNA polymerase [Urbifossiella limnaea]QDU20038.1 DNA polymerase IV [Urbifossiella limnaea]